MRLISHRSKENEPFDKDLSAFLNELRPHSLGSFETFNAWGFGPQSFQALSCHGKSLSELKLHMLPPDSTPHVSLLKDCTNLVLLSLAARELATIDLKKSHNDAFLAMVAWLKECKKLRILSFANFFCATLVMAQTLSENSIRLTSLECEGGGFPGTAQFHQALANQTSLQHLWLKDEENLDEDYLEGPEAADVLVESLCKLVNLTHLRMRRMSDYFTDVHILRLASSLPKLRVWSTSGDRFTDTIWGSVASLKSLHILTLCASTEFTGRGILEFIEMLGPGNQGLSFAVKNAGSDSRLSEVEQELIQEEIATKVQGQFRWFCQGEK